ncbi:MAG: DnaJ domain-containing protein [Tissierellia bacterium]|nr:DnaJ domain-containing protein [Tissierellia bacterium]
MNPISKLYGGFLQGLATFLHGIFEVFIVVLDFIVGLIEGIKRIIISILLMGCMFIFFSPFLLALLFHPAVITLIIIFVFFPMLGTKFISFLRYYQYSITEFLYDKAEYYKTGKKVNANFEDYGNAYRRMQEENYRKSQEQKRRQEEEMWQQVFKEFFEQAQRGGRGYGGYGGYTGSQNGGNYQQPLSQFKTKFEQACNTLEVPYDSDVYKIKLAYRKMAKRYHPDLNHEPGATEKFQEINAAFEFLTEENINRYKQLTNN